jgi:hypothetical protein
MVGIACGLEPNFWREPITDGKSYSENFNLDLISLQLINYAKSLTSAAIPTIMQSAISRQYLYHLINVHKMVSKLELQENKMRYLKAQRN